MNAPINQNPKAYSDEWYQQRSSGIGASEIAAVLGVSPWMSALELWQRKVEPQPKDERNEERLLWGHLLEGAIIGELCRRADVKRADWEPCLMRCQEHSWAIATPDDLLESGEPVEVKNLSEWTGRSWDDIPEHYELQCQHQMLVTGAKRCLFGALIGGQELVWCWIERDEDSIARIVKAGSEFWRRVVEMDPPLSDGTSGARKALSRIVGTEESSIELFRSEIGDTLQDLEIASAEEADAKERLKLAEKRRRALEDSIAQAMGDSSKGYTADGWSFFWRTTERKGYTVEPSSYRTFTVKPPKQARA